MTSGVVVDADVINWMVREWKRAEEDVGPIEQLLDCILDEYGIAVTDWIEHEWKTTAGPQNVGQWFVQKLIVKKIRPVDGSSDPELRKDLRVDYGLPMASRDYRYIALACQLPPHYVLAHDMDFYDPPNKKSNRSMKRRLRLERDGALCRHVKRQYGVRIGCLCHCGGDLNLSHSIAPHELPSYCDC